MQLYSPVKFQEALLYRFLMHPLPKDIKEVACPETNVQNHIFFSNTACNAWMKIIVSKSIDTFKWTIEKAHLAAQTQEVSRGLFSSAMSHIIIKSPNNNNFQKVMCFRAYMITISFSSVYNMNYPNSVCFLFKRYFKKINRIQKLTKVVY